MTIKLTVSISPELDAALDCAVAVSRMSKSRTVEVYLREHPQVEKYIQLVRSEPDEAVLVAAPAGRTRKNRTVTPRSSA